MHSRRLPPGPGQESVWDYPRPPRCQDCQKHIYILFNGIIIADTHASKRLVETSHPPVYYIPPQDVHQEYLRQSSRGSWCEWKGQAGYYSIIVNDKQANDAAWFYPNPAPAYNAIKDYVAFYPGLMDACYIDDEKVEPQPGGFYGGWITKNIIGPFKGASGTWGW